MSKFFFLNKLFSLEKAFEMCHLPHSSADKDEDLKMIFEKNSNDESSMISRKF